MLKYLERDNMIGHRIGQWKRLIQIRDHICLEAVQCACPIDTNVSIRVAENVLFERSLTAAEIDDRT